MRKTGDQTFGTLLYWGCVLSIGGFVGAGIFYVLIALPFPMIVRSLCMYLAYICIAAFVGGLMMLLVTLLAGIRTTHGRPKGMMQYPESKVIARYAINQNGETLFDELYIDPEDPKIKYYVRIQLPNGLSSEFHCNNIVWANCAEAMTGTAVIQGDWVGQFIPKLGIGQGDPYGSQRV